PKNNSTATRHPQPAGDRFLGGAAAAAAGPSGCPQFAQNASPCATWLPQWVQNIRRETKQPPTGRQAKEKRGRGRPRSQMLPIEGLVVHAVHERAQLTRARRMSQLAQRLRLDLPYALARHRKRLAHFLQRVLRAIFQAEAHLDDLL